MSGCVSNFEFLGLFLRDFPSRFARSRKMGEERRGREWGKREEERASRLKMQDSGLGRSATKKLRIGRWS
eukprot:754267-Hanusia_phi.AAC.5